MTPVQCIARLLELLAAGQPHRIGREHFRTAGLVDGWRVIYGPGQAFTVDGPTGRRVLERDALVSVLEEEWVPDARGAVAAVVVEAGMAAATPPPRRAPSRISAVRLGPPVALLLEDGSVVELGDVEVRP